MNSRIDLITGLKAASASIALFAAGMGVSLAVESPAVAQNTSDRGQGQRGGQGGASGDASESQGQRGLDDILRDVAPVAIEVGEEEDSDRPSWAGVGRRASGDEAGGEEEEDSDRPEWAGGGGGRNDRGEPPSDAGSTRGDLYGDMYVILRDANGVPILNEDGFVQPIDADGNPIPLDEEGAPIDPTLAIEVEMGRLNVGRSPDQVLDSRAAEVVTLLSEATAITTDPAGRLLVTSPDGSTKTIDAPLENLALYVALMTLGTIPGVTDLPGTEFDHLVDGTLTVEDMASATALLAGASDKFETLSPDAVAYMNAILGISTVTEGDVTWSAVDYSTFSYDRSDTFADVTTTVLVQQTDGSWMPTEVNVYDAVFGSTDYSSTAFAAFAQAVDDARAVVNYIHEYEVPVVAPTPGE